MEREKERHEYEEALLQIYGRQGRGLRVELGIWVEVVCLEVVGFRNKCRFCVIQRLEESWPSLNFAISTGESREKFLEIDKIRDSINFRNVNYEVFCDTNNLIFRLES